MIFITFVSPATPLVLTKLTMSISWIAGRFLALCGVPGVEDKLGRLEDGQLGHACAGDGMVLRHGGREAFSFSEEPGSGWWESVCEATRREMKVVFGASALKLGTAFPPPMGLLSGRVSPAAPARVAGREFGVMVALLSPVAFGRFLLN